MKSRTVPFFNYPEMLGESKQEVLDAISNVIDRGAYILQKDLTEFEESLKSYLNVKHAIGVADGTNALLLALRAAGIGEGDEVIMASHTYVATAGAVHYVGAKPVLVDCGPDHMIDPAQIEPAISARTKVIMPTQLNGRTADMDKIAAIADKHGLRIIEDAAQALGSKFKDQYAGTFGTAGTFSFYPAKLLGCLGDGGAVVTNDDFIGEQVRLLRDHGRDDSGEFVSWGTNSRLDNIQAAVLNVRLKSFDRDLLRRREIASLYQQGLCEIENLHLPPAPSRGDHYDVYQNYEIECAERQELLAYLSERNIRCIVQWGGKPVHQLAALDLGPSSLPYTDEMFKKCMLLPMNTTLSNDDVEYVIATIRSFYGNK